MEKGSVAVVFVHAALAPLAGRAQVAQALAEAQIPPERLALRETRVSAEQYGRLWLAVARTLDDEFFGQDARRMKRGSFALLCQTAAAAPTLGQAMRRAARFFGVILDDFAVGLALQPPGRPKAGGAPSGGRAARASGQAWGPSTLPPGHAARARLEVRALHAGPARPFAHETLLIMLHGLMCWLAGRRIPVREAGFAYAEPAHSGEYRVMYAPLLRFDEPLTYLDFEAAVLDVPIQRTPADVRRFLRAAPANFIVKYQNPDGWAAQVRRRLKRTPPPAWPALAELAASLGTTPSTLRRRLEQEGQSYRGIREQLRRDLAIEWLAGTRRSVTSIALELGFADPSAFRRAFRQWTGARPGDYRGGEGPDLP